MVDSSSFVVDSSSPGGSIESVECDVAVFVVAIVVVAFVVIVVIVGVVKAAVAEVEFVIVVGIGFEVVY